MTQESFQTSLADRSVVLGRRVAFLHQVEIFRDCPRDLLVTVAGALVPHDLAPGAILCREGEPGHDFFLIESGFFTISVEVGGHERELAQLGPGQFVGEMALLGGGKRTATVRADSAARVWALSSADFDALLQRNPALDEAIRRTARARGIATKRRIHEVERQNLAALMQGRTQLRIGRYDTNDLVLASPLASGYHAVIERSGAGFVLRDLGSTNGTYVNGVRVDAVPLANGADIWMGGQRFIFDQGEMLSLIEPRGIRIDAFNLFKVIKGNKALLNDISLSILPGEFVAIVGGSGAGKTTLMDAISGVRPPTGGSVLYNGSDYYRQMALYRDMLGYVPQDDIIHTGLPLRRTLWHAARLRLPLDTSKRDLGAVVDRTLDVLNLTAQANVLVGSLSGGQRKRSSIGVELLTRPRVFFLDEPTSGLDPDTDRQMMDLLRRLADEGSTVVLTTHATKNVRLCDKIIFLARGGHLAFVGAPQRALEYFGAADFDEIYGLLANEASPEEWHRRFAESADAAAAAPALPRTDHAAPGGEERHALGAGSGSGGVRRWLRQFAVLSRRNFDLRTRRPDTLMPLIMPPVMFTVLLIALFRSGSFDRNVENPSAAVQLLFLLCFTIFIFGLLFGVQEIVSEFPIFRRERMVSLGIVPYVLSKISFLVPLMTLLIGGMLVALRLTHRLPDSGVDVYGKLLLTLVLTAVAGLAAALLTSAAVSTSQQASDLLSLWIMPQVLFAGALFAIPSMNVVGRLISRFMAVRWSFESMGQIADLNRLFTEGGTPIGQSLVLQYESTFSGGPARNWVLLGIFIVVPLVLTCLILQRRSSTG